MKRSWWTALGASGAFALSACGSTVQVAGSHALPGNGGLDLPRTTGGQDPFSPGTGVGGPSGAGGPGALPGSGRSDGRGTTSGGEVHQPGGPDVVAPGTTSTKPIEIGVLVTDTDSFKAAPGVGQSYTTVTRDSIHVYLNEINAAGGVAGRKLTPVDFSFQYAAASYDNEFEAACQTFTKDHSVGAVIYDGVVYNQSFNSCLTRAGVPVFYLGQAGTQVGDSTDFANNPGMITTGSVNVDRRLKSILTGAIKHGYLRPGARLGIFVETCAYNVRAYERTVAPLVARHKLTVDRVDVDCGAGASAQGTGTAAVGSAALRFQSNGVDNVMFVSNYENGLVYYFAAQAEAQRYRPQYLVFHNQGCPACLAAWSNTKQQLVRMRGFGGSPLWDVTHPPTPPAAQAAARRACLATTKRHGIPASGLDIQTIILDVCDAVNLLQRALTLSGGQAGTRPIVTALARLGTDFVSTITLTGTTRFGSGRRDGMELTAVSVYQPKCECIAYITPPASLP